MVIGEIALVILGYYFKDDIEDMVLDYSKDNEKYYKDEISNYQTYAKLIIIFSMSL